MSSRCCTLPYNISRRSSWPHKGLHGQRTFPSRVRCLLSSCLQGLSGKRGSQVTGVSVNGTTHRKPHVVPDFLTVSSKIRGKAARKHVCCAIWLSRGAGIGGGVIEGTVSIVSISAPPCGSGWMDNIIPGKASIKLGRVLKIKFIFKFILLLWRWSLPRFAFMADPGLQLWSNFGVKFYYITLPSDTCSQRIREVGHTKQLQKDSVLLTLGWQWSAWSFPPQHILLHICRFAKLRWSLGAISSALSDHPLWAFVCSSVEGGKSWLVGALALYMQDSKTVLPISQFC